MSLMCQDVPFTILTHLTQFLPSSLSVLLLSGSLSICKKSMSFVSLCQCESWYSWSFLFGLKKERIWADRCHSYNIHLDIWSPISDFDQSLQSGFCYLSLAVLILVASHLLLTLCSVGLSLYLQSRFIYTFDNQIIYVITKYTHTHKYIYICLYVVSFRTSLWMVKLWIFARWISRLVSWRNVFLLALLNPLVNWYILSV